MSDNADENQQIIIHVSLLFYEVMKNAIEIKPEIGERARIIKDIISSNENNGIYLLEKN